MIRVIQGDLFKTDVDALVNTVNTVGVMGKGVALQFKRRYPENFKAYHKAYKANELEVGKMFTFDRGELSQPRFIINFPTKQHWRSPSKLEYIAKGLTALAEEVKRLNITSIAIPALGCSNGGLDWDDVKPMIVNTFHDFNSVDVILLAPLDEKLRTFVSSGSSVGFTSSASLPLEQYAHEFVKNLNQKPRLTLGRALIIKLLDVYREPGYHAGRLEAQKLAYFLQESGQSLKLRFDSNHYGPYAHNLNHVLIALDGFYINGYGDGSKRSNLTVNRDLLPEVNKRLQSEPVVVERLERVAALIEGYETPYGMELLATTHWLNAHEGKTTLSDVKYGFKNWSQRKAKLFNDNHIESAWNSLRDQGWLKQ